MGRSKCINLREPIGKDFINKLCTTWQQRYRTGAGPGVERDGENEV